MTASNPRQPSRAAKPSSTPKSSRRRPEQALQKLVVEHLELAYPGLLFFHVPNSSGNRGAHLGGILKAMGVKAGVPDLVLILPNGLAGFIELKAAKGKLSPAQDAFRTRAKALGCLWEEARSLPEVAGILDGWLTPFGWRSRVRIAA